MEILLIYTLYFGATLFPVTYFSLMAFGRIKGILWKEVLVGLLLQLLWSAGVYGIVYSSWKHGDTEYYWGWALLIPVNAVALLWHLSSPSWSKLYKSPSAR